MAENNIGNRIIKYRQPIWDYERDELIEWNYWGFIDGEFEPPIMGNADPNNNCDSQQFTGLKDKNGIEIFEGDVVKCTQKKEEKIGVIMFHNGMWAWDFGEGKSYAFDVIRKWSGEVIGNVFENPSLLPK